MRSASKLGTTPSADALRSHRFVPVWQSNLHSARLRYRIALEAYQALAALKRSKNGNQPTARELLEEQKALKTLEAASRELRAAVARTSQWQRVRTLN
jgi:hypothetical protein